MTRSMRIAVPFLAALALGTIALVQSLKPRAKTEEARRRDYYQMMVDLRGRFRSRVGTTAPDLRFRLLSDDSDHQLSEFRGRSVILNFWATHCGPCRSEMPDLVALQSRFESRLAVITLTAESPEKVSAFLSNRPIALPRFSGYTKNYEGLPHSVIPVTLFLDRERTIRAFIIGKPSKSDFEKALQPYL